MILGFGLGIQEMIICGIVAVLLFGKRLPEVARSVGQSYEQFRKSLREIQTEVDSAVRAAGDVTSRSHVVTYPDDHDDEMPSTPRFEPPQLEDATEQTSESSPADSNEGDSKNASESEETDAVV